MSIVLVANNAYKTPQILYDNRFADATPTATDTAAGFFAASIADWRGYTFWQGASAGQKYLTVDCATAKVADCLAIFGHNFATAAADVTVDSSDNGSTWTNRQAAFTPDDDTTFVISFDSAAARYWRVGINTAAVVAQCAVVCLGVAVTMPDYPDAPYTPFNEEAMFERSRSKAGHILGVTRQYLSESFSPTFSVILKTWVDTYLRPFWRNHASHGLPFFYAGNSEGTGTDCHFVTLSDSYRFTGSQGDSLYLDSITLDMEGVVE